MQIYQCLPDGLHVINAYRISVKTACHLTAMELAVIHCYVNQVCRTFYCKTIYLLNFCIFHIGYIFAELFLFIFI